MQTSTGASLALLITSVDTVGSVRKSVILLGLKHELHINVVKTVTVSRR